MEHIGSTPEHVHHAYDCMLSPSVLFSGREIQGSVIFRASARFTGRACLVCAVALANRIVEVRRGSAQE